MLSSLLLTATCTVQSAFAVPAGYYTVAEIARTLERHGISVGASPDCANDVYALNFPSATWPQIAKALTQDERLAIGRTGERWTFRRAAEGLAADRLTLQKYLSSARDGIGHVYGKASETCRELEKLDPEERQAEIDRLEPPTGAKPSQKALRQLVYLYSGVGDILFYEIGIPAYLTRLDATPTFGQASFSNLNQLTPAFVPSGRLNEFRLSGITTKGMKPAEAAEFAENFWVATKLVFDPITQVTATRLACAPGHGGRRFFTGGVLNLITPRKFPLGLSYEAVVREETRRLQATRMNSDEWLQSTEFNRSTPLPKRPMRASEAFLRVAKTQRVALVYYVSPFTDVMLKASPSRSLGQLLADINADRSDPDWQNVVLRERVSATAKPSSGSPLAGWPKLSASRISDGLLIRNELRFLDGLCQSPATLPTAIENARLKGKQPALAEIISHTAALNIRGWKNSYFSSNYLEHCNPVSFRPFALAMQKSNRMQRAMRDANASVATIPFSSLEPAAKSELLRGLSESGRFNDAINERMLDELRDPMHLHDFLAQADANELEIRIAKSEGKYDLQLIVGTAVVWQSWVDKIQG